MNNFTQLMNELAVFFEIPNFTLENENSVSFEVGNNTLCIDNHKQNLLISVYRPVLAYEADIPEKALRLCDAHHFPYPIRAGYSQNQLYFTVPIAQNTCSSQVLLKIFEHLKTLHSSL